MHYSRRWGRDTSDGEISDRYRGQQSRSRRVDPAPNSCHDRHLTGAIEVERERERFALHQILAQS